jgi:2',3'-cyclic-nucleotide 2'-phosphodiesterase (5'-nucleotidase family)
MPSDTETPQPPQSNTPPPTGASAGRAQTSQERPSRQRLSLWHWAAIAVLLFTLLGAFYLQRRHVPPDDPNPPVELIVVQLNDVYRLDAVREGKRGGLARVAALLRQLKAQHPNVPVVVFHAGDFLGPSLESNLFHGEQMIDALNFLNGLAPVYAVPGNHEFDYSDKEKGYLADNIARSKFKWIVSNIKRADPALLPALRDQTDERVVEKIGNLKVGIFGLTIADEHGGKDQPYAPIERNYAEVARREIEQLEQDGADIIVGLTHLNMSDDEEMAKLRREHPRFRWIAGGHEHYQQREAGWPGAALITKGDSNARTVWQVTIVGQGDRAELREQRVVVDESINGDPDYARDVENFYRVKLRQQFPYLDDVIAELPKPVQAGRPRAGDQSARLKQCYDGTEETVRERESDWGGFLADNMRRAYKRPAQIAVINGGAIRIDDTFCDRVTFEHLERTFAYDTSVVFVKLAGRYVRDEILKHSAEAGKGSGGFLQVSGVRFRLGAGSDGRKSIEDVQVQSDKGWADLQEDKPYAVAVTNYLFLCGGDGYRFRQYVTDYIPAGPDLRTLTYNALATQSKKPTAPAPARIIDFPFYTKPPDVTAVKWKRLDEAEQKKLDNEAERKCR